MTTLLTLAVLFLLVAGLARYARNDHFAGAASVAESHDELGSLLTRHRLVPRH